MPPSPESPSPSTFRARTSRFGRIVGFTFVTAVATFCLMLLVVRFVLYPQVESHRQDIAAMLGRELGATVEIDTIQTGWQGWNPEFVVRGFRIRGQQVADTVLELPELRGIVSWTSLLTADLRMRELVVERPRLSVRRDAQGSFHVAGFALDDDRQDKHSRSTDWLLRQRSIVVRNAQLSWNDEFRGAPPLQLDDVHVRLESGFGHHRFGLRGTPPREIAAPIDVRGDFTDATFEDWRKAAGRLYLRLDFADMAAWSKWVPMPVPVESGDGAMRLWFTVEHGVARELVADLELATVRTRLRDDLPPLELAHLAGRITWTQQDGSRALSARGLELLERRGIAIPSTDFALRYQVNADGAVASGRMSVGALDLEPVAMLAGHVPLPAGVRDSLHRHAPRGRVNDVEYAWEGAFDAPATFRARGAFADVAAQPVDAFPGFSGWSGRVDATQAGGTLELRARAAALHLPRVFPEALAFETAGGRIEWQRKPQQTSVRVENLQFANAHIMGTAQGTWRSAAKGPGEIDATARITKADGRSLHRYLPSVVGEPTRVWLRDSLRSGAVDDARLVLNGDLARFPFVDGKGGTFLVTVNVRDASLDYAQGWPPLSAVDAQLRFEGQSLGIDAARGTVLGAALGRTTARVADLSLEYPVLAVDGEASGPTGEFLQFIRKSPVAAWIDHFTDDASAAGNGKLALNFQLPLGHPDAPPKVVGEYQFTDNTLGFPGVPALSAINGKLTFSERHLEGRDIALTTLGGPARLDIASADGVVKVKAKGHAATATVARELDAPLAERFSGEADWQLVLDAREGAATWTVESNLSGVAIDLPAPMAKSAADAVPLRVERRPLGKDGARDAIIVDYGTTSRIVAQRVLGASGATVDRALVLLGKAMQQTSAVPDRAGITLRGDVDAVNVDQWLELAAPGGKQAAAKPSLELEAVDVTAGSLVALGRKFDAMTLSARRAAQRWRLRFDSRQLDGTAEWEPAGSGLANGRISAQLAELDFISMREASVPDARVQSPRREGSANTWPELDIKSERFIGRAGNLGRMELVARPEGTDWRVTRFSLINAGGRIDAEGTWRLIGRQQQTRFDVNVATTDTSAFLTHVGFPGDVKGGSAKLTGQLGWPGGPAEFDYDTLAGSFRVDVGAGQFTKMDPGVGKLLGVLSLQALPRRISLDFRDVFSEGFAFDTIAGNVKIASGVMHTDDLLVQGPAAKVVLAGSVDLSKETQQLRVRVQPSLSSVVSTGAGAAAVVLLAANPLVGAAVGAGTLLAQKMMKDPIEQMFSYEYTVRGSWSDPVVERVARLPSLPGAQSAEK